MRKQFFQLCSGPLKGRTFNADAMRTVTKVGRDGAALRFAVSDEHGEARVMPCDIAATAGAPSHVYETFARADEITLEVVLCKYIGTSVSIALRET